MITLLDVSSVVQMDQLETCPAPEDPLTHQLSKSITAHSQIHTVPSA